MIDHQLTYQDIVAEFNRRVPPSLVDKYELITWLGFIKWPDAPAAIPKPL